MADDRAYVNVEVAMQISDNVCNLAKLMTHRQNRSVPQSAEKWLDTTMLILDNIGIGLKRVIAVDPDDIEVPMIWEDVTIMSFLIDLIALVITDVHRCVDGIYQVVTQSPDAKSLSTVEANFENARKSKHMLNKFAANLWEPYSTALTSLKYDLLSVSQILSDIRRKSLVFLWEYSLEHNCSTRDVQSRLEEDRAMEKEYVLESTRQEFKDLVAALGPTIYSNMTSDQLDEVMNESEEDRDKYRGDDLESAFM